MAAPGSFAPPAASAGMRRGTRTAMVLLNAAYLCASPVFWFFWNQRTRFSLPDWAVHGAGFAAGILPVLMFTAGWAVAAVLIGRGQRQAAGRAFNRLSFLGLFTAAVGMLVLTGAGLRG